MRMLCNTMQLEDAFVANQSQVKMDVREIKSQIMR